MVDSEALGEQERKNGSSVIVGNMYMEKFLIKVASMGDCPPSLDRLMVEQMIDLAGADSSNLKVISETVPKLNVHSSKFACIFCLKLLRKLLRRGIGFDRKENVTSFLHRCLKAVRMEDFSFLCAIFQLLSVLEGQGIADEFQTDAWNLAISCLKTDGMTIFVKKATCEYCKLLIEKKDCNLDFAPLVSVLCSGDDSFDCISEIFVAHPEMISEAAAEIFCSNALKKRSFTHSYVELLAVLFEKNVRLIDLVTSKKWISQRLKLNVLRCMVSNGCSGIMKDLLQERNLTLGDLLACFKYLSEKEQTSYLVEWIPKLNDLVICPKEDVVAFLQSPWIDEKKYDDIFDSLLERFWKSPDLLRIMLQRYGNWALKKQQSVINLASSSFSSPDWERRDAAIELLRCLPKVAFRDGKRLKRA
ncbi:unnamed protein product [Enterobius vermicularis]|uniref:Uncharacterized protein n=1 Tax=Enterobius vermicularis TaxID=51028 RepID=A0A0N4UW79_ENTVE|nr:unnamed protein product [Enterobius vermicularis]